MSALGQGYPSANDVATLMIGSRRYEGWKSVEVSASIEQAARTFGFETSTRWPNEANPIRIRPGDVAEVWLGPDKVCTGYVDKVETAHDSGSHTIAVTGRSKTCDLVDCSADGGGQYTKLSVLQVASALAAPYDVDVIADGDVGAVLDSFVLQPNETVFAAIERMARLRSLLVTDTADGELLLTRAGTSHAIGAFVAGEGGNILEASASYDFTARFSDYRVRGQGRGTNTNYGKAASGAYGAATDDAIDRLRVLNLRAEGHADKALCQTRALWEAATRAGRSVSIGATVQGWRQVKNGDLWTPNLVAQVTDSAIGIDDELLIVSCAWRLGPGGTTCAAQLAPAIGYVPEPLSKRKIRGSSAIGILKDLPLGVTP